MCLIYLNYQTSELSHTAHCAVPHDMAWLMGSCGPILLPSISRENKTAYC
jgi:hypothetical protein